MILKLHAYRYVAVSGGFWW